MSSIPASPSVRSDGAREPTIWEVMASLLDRAATVITDGPSPTPARRWPESAAVFEAKVLLERLGTPDPARWIAELTGVYLAEGAGELRALGALLRAGTPTGALEPVVRAVFERTGRINWVLEEPPKVDWRARAARASFEALVSSYHYRRGVEAIKAKPDERKAVVEEFRRIRADVLRWFEVERPLQDSDGTRLNPNVEHWTIAGERYPKYEQLARWSIFDKSDAGSVPAGVYGGLSGFSHPSFIATRELRIVDEGRFSYSYSFDYVERIARLAAFGLGDAFKHWLGYYDHDHDHDRLVAALDEVFGEWEALVGQPEVDDEQPTP